MDSFTRAQREHGARRFGGHFAGTRGAEAPAPARLSLSASPARPSRNTRHLFPRPQEGDLRPRLLLAPARRVPADHHTEDTPIVLDGEVPQQRGARPLESERPRCARMERSGRLGVRNRGSGDACVTPGGFPRPRGAAIGHFAARRAGERKRRVERAESAVAARDMRAGSRGRDPRDRWWGCPVASRCATPGRRRCPPAPGGVRCAVFRRRPAC